MRSPHGQAAITRLPPTATLAAPGSVEERRAMARVPGLLFLRIWQPNKMVVVLCYEVLVFICNGNSQSLLIAPGAEGAGLSSAPSARVRSV